MEEESSRRKCQLCNFTAGTTKTLINHYKLKHGLGPHDDIIKATPKSPKKKCKNCKKSVSNIYAHRHSCKAPRPTDECTTEGEPSPEKKKTSTPSGSGLTPSGSGLTPAGSGLLTPANPERLSDDQFMKRYKTWLESAHGNFASEKTIRDYSRQVRRFIEAQLAMRPGFSARHWMGFGSRNFVALSPIEDWIPRTTKSAHAGQKICAYKQLLGMIRSSLVRCGAGSPDFATRVAHLDEMNRQASKLARNFKSGRFARASGEERDATTSTVSFRGWRKLIKAYRKSELRRLALERFSGNKWRCSGLKVRNDRDAQIFLALETYFQSAGMFSLFIYSFMSNARCGFNLDPPRMSGV